MSLDGPVPGVPEAQIRQVALLPPHLADCKAAGPFMEAKPGELLMTVPRIARCLIRGGTTIEVEPSPQADPDAVAMMVHGAARAVLILQRGELPLEAATLMAPNGAGVAICGISGAGKSTVAAELARRGWLLVADDITRIVLNGQAAAAWPTGGGIKLWRDACEMLAIDPAPLRRVRKGKEKFFLMVPAANSAVRLTHIVQLRVPPMREAPRVARDQAMSVLATHAFRPRYINAVGRGVELDRMIAKLASICQVFRITGSRSRPVKDIADQVAGAIG